MDAKPTGTKDFGAGRVHAEYSIREYFLLNA